jgi:hypothetical protein
MGTKISDRFPSRFLKAFSLNGREVVAVISHVDEIMPDGQTKPAIHFVGGKLKPLIMNRTIANQIVDGCNLGDDPDLWKGKYVTLHLTTTDFRGEVKQVVRVKPANGATPSNNIPPPTSADDYNDPIPF